jgi:DNA-binding ferritin-like protein
MNSKQALGAKTLKTLKQLIKANGLFEDSPKIYQLREQLNECVRSYE